MELQKAATGVKGLDEITDGGLPQRRPTLVCGGPGCGKTFLAMQFILHGAVDIGEPGVFVSFEEPVEDLAKNFSSLGVNLHDLMDRGRMMVDHVRVDRHEIIETGDFDLGGLFIRLQDAIDTVGAKRVALDTIETLFVGFSNAAILRAELRRLFEWLKSKGVTAIVTGEPGEHTLTRHGLEEYVADCVIVLDHRVCDQISTRRLRVVKYRGSRHGADEYPFLVSKNGISVLPITSLGLDHMASNERISSGIEGLDAMLEQKGYYRGSSILISGAAGTGKTSVCAHFADAACRRGEHGIYFAFEEPPSYICRNMLSIGIDLERLAQAGSLHFRSVRPTRFGLEMHLADILEKMARESPSFAIFDPISNFSGVGDLGESRAMLVRLIDFLKSESITGLFTNLSQKGESERRTEIGVSSSMDTWILLENVEANGERNRCISVLKSRGMDHSNQVRELQFTGHGLHLANVYAGPGGVLTGTARMAQEAQERSQAVKRQQEIEAKEALIEQRRRLMEAELAHIRSQFAVEEAALLRDIREERLRESTLLENRQAIAAVRDATTTQKQ